jgi:hypothetical protein
VYVCTLRVALLRLALDEERAGAAMAAARVSVARVVILPVEAAERLLLTSLAVERVALTTLRDVVALLLLRLLPATCRTCADRAEDAVLLLVALLRPTLDREEEAMLDEREWREFPP